MASFHDTYELKRVCLRLSEHRVRGLVGRALNLIIRAVCLIPGKQTSENLTAST